MTQAKSGDRVRFHYSGKLIDGTEFDSSVGGEPLEATLGEGQIIGGLEAGIDGMTVGEKSTISIAAIDAYGTHDPAKVQDVDRKMMPANIDLQIGLQLGARTQSGEQIAFTVAAIGDETVTVDANHPLAGKDLVFEIELIEIV